MTAGGRPSSPGRGARRARGSPSSHPRSRSSPSSSWSPSWRAFYLPQPTSTSTPWATLRRRASSVSGTSRRCSTTRCSGRRSATRSTSCWSAGRCRWRRRSGPPSSSTRRLVRCKGLFRTVYFAPVVTTLVAVAVVWRYLYHPRFGLLNRLLASSASGPSTGSATHTGRCRRSILLAVWKNFGYNMIILVAGLQSVPASLYEAARVDGAGPWQQFRHVTLPVLAPDVRLRRRDHDDRLLPALRRAVRHDQRRRPARTPRSRSCCSCTSRASAGGTSASRAAIALRALPDHPRRARCCSAAPEGAASEALDRDSIGLHLAAGGRWRVVTLAPLLWMVSASFMPSGEATPSPPPLPAEPADARALPRAVSRGSTSARCFLNSAVRRRRVDRASLADRQLDGGLRLRQAPLPRRATGSSGAARRAW